jgi:hypothetical protein
MSRKIGRIFLIIIVFGLVVFLLLQFIPFGKDFTNPPVITEPNWDSPQTRELAKRACFDCHSNETVWTWYSKIAPASWLIFSDVARGRDEFNFSDWQNAPLREAEEAAEVIDEGEMPLPQYLLLHPDARLTEAEKQALINGLIATISR